MVMGGGCGASFTSFHRGYHPFSGSEREAWAVVEDLVQGREHAAGPGEIVRRQAKILVTSEEHARVIYDGMKAQGLQM